ncbi:ABC transporter substrate-binding protein [Spirochaeta lutea]|uniref:ABC transporter substrate-binding protein n=1 Tax=Spirochaeta lutea TaxID=1480694 RepID=A0A098QTN6_9SPIO|nr:ABC transporter substrate-binding protein [Spirochaeta lutea]KGE71240.1 ABC transporter substrate-binding protein [Spirochaeta lutea]
MKRLGKAIILVMIAALLVPAALFAGGQGEQQAQPSAEAQKTVRIFGAFRAEEAARFREALKPFIDRTGINVIYEGSPEFETQILVQAEAGTPPDIAALPQPGLMYNLAGRGYLKPLPQSVINRIDANYTSAWKDLGTYEGNVYGVFHRVNAKSFVWYPKKAFEAAGYEIPTTWDELRALTQEIAADGIVPWSIGMESGAATGWVATDWMEDIMLRTAGPDVYDQWVNHEIPFNHPAVQRAAEIMAELWMDADYVLGGPTNILTTNFGDAISPLFTGNPPRAMLHRQGNFITSFMPEDVQANLEEEVGVFALPSIDEQWGTPVLGGGDQFVMFSQRPEVVQVMEFLTTWDSAKSWAQAGGALFPHQDQNFDDYGSSLEADLARILVNAEVFRFDASDLMPAEVGAGTFWTGMADLVSGVDISTVLTQIERSWPR